MPKKTSRAARVQQNSRLQEVKREMSARPMMPTNSTTKSGGTAVASTPLRVDVSAHDLADAPARPTPAQVPEKLETVVAPAPRVTPATTVVPRRFLNAQPKQNAAHSREEEYRFIKADLVTVLVLAILMIVALIVLTIIIGR